LGSVAYRADHNYPRDRRNVHGIRTPSFRVRLEHRSLGLPHLITIVIAAFTAMGLLLVVLHRVESAFWAAVYLWLGALDPPGAAILYSVDAMATRGASGLMLHPHWQMMGALEAADGMLLFGISTAFIFTVMQFYYQHLVLHPRRPRQGQISADRRPPTRGRQIERLRDLARAPGRLTAALRVDRWLDGVDFCREGLPWLARDDDNPDAIGQSIRIGIALFAAYAVCDVPLPETPEGAIILPRPTRNRGIPADCGVGCHAR